VNLTNHQAKYLHKVLSFYDWTKGRELSSADLNIHQQVYAKVQDQLSRFEAGLQDPAPVVFPFYKPATSEEEA
jgi:hypothetical protein